MLESLNAYSYILAQEVDSSGEFWTTLGGIAILLLLLVLVILALFVPYLVLRKALDTKRLFEIIEERLGSIDAEIKKLSDNPTGQ